MDVRSGAMREYFEEWTKKSRKPAFSIADLKRTVRSENIPHNHFQWGTNARDDALITAEDTYLGLKLLSRLHPEKAVEHMVLSAFFPLQAAIVEKIKERESGKPQTNDDRSIYKEANELEAVFETAIDRALDRLMTKTVTR